MSRAELLADQARALANGVARERRRIANGLTAQFPDSALIMAVAASILDGSYTGAAIPERMDDVERGRRIAELMNEPIGLEGASPEEITELGLAEDGLPPIVERDDDADMKAILRSRG